MDYSHLAIIRARKKPTILRSGLLVFSSKERDQVNFRSFYAYLIYGEFC
jgi:hypothetical protein